MSQKNEPVMTTATERVKPNFWRKRLLQGLLVWYTIFWVWMAIAPVDRRDWLLENLLVFVLVGVLAATYRKFPLSDLSYVLITTFLTLHGVGAHYTYSEVPLGFWIKDTFDLSRNHFDRIAHFSYGLLMAYPVREVFLRVANARGFWAYYLPLDVTLSFSALFEIVEAVIAQFVAPNLGNAYLGTQGDVWDAQKDMTAVLVGALLCMALTAVLGKFFGKGERVQSPLRPAPR